ncbi:MAG: beta-propeller fold lactonase family protein [bacterium]|nr:beta-propeller fold lactonase family protein [bacterium]
MSYHVYITNSGSDHLSKFVMDGKTGRLTQEADMGLGSPPGALATTTDGGLMFICMRGMKQYQSFRVDRSTGALTQVGATSVQEGAPYIKADYTNRFLLATYYGAGAVSVHAIGDDGSLGPEPIQWIETEAHAHSIQLDRSNRFAFVPHTNPPNAIYQFRFDEKTGRLSPNDPPKIHPQTPEGPRHFVFHPTRDLLYSVNENGCTVSAHHFNSKTGTLSSFQVISTLPAGWDSDSKSTAEIKMAPDGRCLYASNRGHDSIAIFSVNKDGSLTALGHQPTEATPRFFELDPTGNFLLSVGQKSGHLSSYRINHENGKLEQMERFEVGKSPLWIQFVEKQA